SARSIVSPAGRAALPCWTGRVRPGRVSPTVSMRLFSCLCAASKLLCTAYKGWNSSFQLIRSKALIDYSDERTPPHPQAAPVSGGAEDERPFRPRGGGLLRHPVHPFRRDQGTGDLDRRDPGG